MPVENVNEFECSASFLVNFTGDVDCTLSLNDSDSITASSEGEVGIRKAFTFTRGTNTSGRFDYHIASVYTDAAGTQHTVANGAPPGVSVTSQGFTQAPNFSAGVNSNQGSTWVGAVDASGFKGQSFGMTITVGFKP